VTFNQLNTIAFSQILTPSKVLYMINREKDYVHAGLFTNITIDVFTSN